MYGVLSGMLIIEKTQVIKKIIEPMEPAIVPHFNNEPIID